ncbi:MAG: DNA translocase FtsK 4TM domain-containing protein [Flavobacteriales bacterium]|jgi:S-DNA-T family DNA segregation ATPase FtsK/SpoIIIE|uniref:DNA translocase FtsK 4TM domain-containing protein n=1 Tax=Blattabacterium sp. (Mastotermes darwiniensis) TaxID=39768 RepID=UPI000231DF68|nr:DNA translocase FtsK 4TM domain-containing protein [Blattabacterium sp. (Mastotermes darwiniensis)]AER40384.1 DNA translocase [Blattabacterium sp. (Mastotermes darwiniensis) str. MADAR]MDR1804895.1 DNA translocase FtsK 4TM domain-containing protein [Flavobacteriales bacterium]
MYKNFHKKNIIETIFGFFLLGNSIFLFLSFFSFLFHWKNDQSQIGKFLDEGIVVENLLGKIGATISHYLIYCGIGISAFFFPLLLLLIGLRIFFVGKLILKIYQSIMHKFLFFSLWFPITFYLFFPKNGILSGIFGFEIGIFLIGLFGKVGLGILVTSIFILYIMLRIKKKNIRKQTLNENRDFLFKRSKKNFFHHEKKKFSMENHPFFSNKESSTSIIIYKNEKNLVEKNKNKIIQILNHYNIGIDKIKYTIGPNITLYEIFPKVGVRISKIKNLENEMALNLYSLGIRIIAPIPGKGSVGIEVPNNQRSTVYMRNILYSEESLNKSHNMELPIFLGQTVFNEIFIVDLAKMPHLLIAGSTGQGKSVWLNAVIVFLLCKKNPEDLKFILIDPKKVELSVYKKISKSYFAMLPNSIDPIITNIHEVKKILNALCKEMDKRYDLLEKSMVRNIKEYNGKYKKYHLPYIILIIDEFSDLSLSFQKKKIEIYITRLAQLSRAVGIHLIIATQRPSVDVITGLIKSNFTERIAFRVSSKIDSRTILDCTGAEQLIGRGDLLFSNKNELIRLQGPFIDLSDIQKIVDFYGENKNNEYFFLPYPDEK